MKVTDLKKKYGVLVKSIRTQVKSSEIKHTNIIVTNRNLLYIQWIGN